MSLCPLPRSPIAAKKLLNRSHAPTLLEATSAVSHSSLLYSLFSLFGRSAASGLPCAGGFPRDAPLTQACAASASPSPPVGRPRLRAAALGLPVRAPTRGEQEALSPSLQDSPRRNDQTGRLKSLTTDHHMKMLLAEKRFSGVVPRCSGVDHGAGRVGEVGQRAKDGVLH